MHPTAEEVADAIKAASQLTHQFIINNGSQRAARQLEKPLGLPPLFARVTMNMIASYHAQLRPTPDPATLTLTA